ncbi:MAG: HlyD family efflux transporter periplasmic adaptor subunit [Lachnospiraceae bacterium]
MEAARGSAIADAAATKLSRKVLSLLKWCCFKETTLGGYELSDKKSNKILKYRKRWNMNIGIVVFGIVFLYLLITIFLFLTEKHVSVYEVRNGTILRDNAYTGLVLREESVISSEGDGYITYYTPESEKVAVGTNIYTLTPEKSPNVSVKQGEEQPLTLSKEEQRSLQLKIQKFNRNFDEQNFSTTYQIQSEVDNVYETVSSHNKINQLNQLISNGDTTQFQMSPAPDDGIIAYYTDGYEGLKFENLTAASFDKSNYAKQEFTNNQKVTSGMPVYKLITNEEWSIVVPLSKKTANELKDQTVIKVNIIKDNELLWANLKIQKIANKYYGILSFDNSMIRYDTDRFLDVELIMENESGLKIPKSAKVKKEFYLVPESYITKGGNGSGAGVLLQQKSKRKDGTTEFVPVEIYNKTEKGMCYLDTRLFHTGDVLVMPESSEVLTLGDNKKKLEGVYNINKGYTIFKIITILSESDEYYIVKAGNNYGLSNYDHIVLDGNTVKEDDVIFK